MAVAAREALASLKEEPQRREIWRRLVAHAGKESEER